MADGRDERFPSPFNKQGSMVSLVVSVARFREACYTGLIVVPFSWAVMSPQVSNEPHRLKDRLFKMANFVLRDPLAFP